MFHCFICRKRLPTALDLDNSVLRNERYSSFEKMIPDDSLIPISKDRLALQYFPVTLSKAYYLKAQINSKVCIICLIIVFYDCIT